MLEIESGELLSCCAFSAPDAYILIRVAWCVSVEETVLIVSDRTGIGGTWLRSSKDV
jgi:hypothetical protein